ncbi:hypothetical protein FKM82_026297 [Ascaphus truei]
MWSRAAYSTASGLCASDKRPPHFLARRAGGGEQCEPRAGVPEPRFLVTPPTSGRGVRSSVSVLRTIFFVLSLPPAPLCCRAVGARRLRRALPACTWAAVHTGPGARNLPLLSVVGGEGE